MSRPPTYQSDAERPTTVSVRIPQELYAQAKQYVAMRRISLTELLLDGLRLRLDTPADPRDILVSQDNTVIQEMQAMIRAAVQQEVGILRDFLGPQAAAVGLRLTPEAPAAPMQEKSYDDNNTVIQEEAGLRLTREASAALAPEVSYDVNNTVIQEQSGHVPDTDGPAGQAAGQPGGDRKTGDFKAGIPALKQPEAAALPPRGYGVLSHKVREAIARQPEPFTPADIAAACGATSRDVWPYLKRGEQAGTLRREHAGKGAPYRRVS
jgi:hypothetical protein